MSSTQDSDPPPSKGGKKTDLLPEEPVDAKPPPAPVDAKPPPPPTAPSPPPPTTQEDAKPAPPKPAPADAKPAPPKPAPADAKPAPPKPAPADAKPAPPKPAPPKPAAAKRPPPPARKAPEPAKPPEFESGMVDRITERFGDRAKPAFVQPNRIGIRTGKEDVLQVAGFIRDELHFDHAESVSGVDYPADGEIEVAYHLGSYLDPALSKQVLALYVRAAREESPDPGNDSTRLPSLRDVFYSVEFHERECFEMLGVYFEGHPDNRRLLLPEDWADLPPLRKDFAIKGR